MRIVWTHMYHHVLMDGAERQLAASTRVKLYKAGLSCVQVAL